MGSQNGEAGDRNRLPAEGSSRSPLDRGAPHGLMGPDPAGAGRSSRLFHDCIASVHPEFIAVFVVSRQQEVYRFTIVAGVVTAVSEFDDGAWELKDLEDGETYALDPSDSTVVIHTESDDGDVRTERWVTTDGGQTYRQAGNDGSSSEDDDSQGENDDNPLVGGGNGSDDGGDDSGDGGNDSGDGGDRYRFQFDGDQQVVAAFKFDDGSWRPLRIDANEEFLVPGPGIARVIKNESDDGELETDVYEDLDGDGEYLEVDSGQGADDDVVFGSPLADRRSGGLGRDELYGEEGDDDLNGEDGDDDLFGDDGDDDLSGGNANDELYGGKGNDDLSGDSGDDALSGQQGKDDLNGGSGADDLQGGAGADRLTGGIGRDLLAGGAARDVFVFASLRDSAVGSRRDVILDYAVNKDALNLEGIDANEKTAGDQAFSWIGRDAFSGVRGQMRYVEDPANNGIVLQADVNGDRMPDFELALQGVNDLSPNHVIF